MEPRWAWLVMLVSLGCSHDRGPAPATRPLYGWWHNGAELLKVTPDEIVRLRVPGTWTADTCHTQLEGATVMFSRGEPFDRGGSFTAKLDGDHLVLPSATFTRATDSESLDYEQRATAALPPADICGRARDCYRAANDKLLANQAQPLDATKDLGPDVGRTACAALMASVAKTLEMQRIPPPLDCR